MYWRVYECYDERQVTWRPVALLIRDLQGPAWSVLPTLPFHFISSSTTSPFPPPLALEASCSSPGCFSGTFQTCSHLRIFAHALLPVLPSPQINMQLPISLRALSKCALLVRVSKTTLFKLSSDLEHFVLSYLLQICLLSTYQYPSHKVSYSQYHTVS